MSGSAYDKKDLTNVSGPLRAALRRLGLGDMDVLFRLMNEWDEVAGAPWAGASSPVFMKDGELVIEAVALPAVRMLRYATGDLMERLDEFCGPGVVESVRIIGPNSSDR